MCCKGTKVKGSLMKEEKLYKKPWFWVCMTIIVFCITRPHVIVMCGNGAGNSNNGNCGKDRETTK